MPFSDRSGRGFENEIAELLADELHATVQCTWWAQRRGFVRNTLNAGACDVIVGAPSGFDPVLTTRPYYRSAYAFVARPGRTAGGAARPVRSFDGLRLRQLRIGVPLAFNIAVGVRRRDRALRDTLDRILARRRQSVDSILDASGVPRVPTPKSLARGG
jgi:hypothetical protein